MQDYDSQLQISLITCIPHNYEVQNKLITIIMLWLIYLYEF